MMPGPLFFGPGIPNGGNLFNRSGVEPGSMFRRVPMYPGGNDPNWMPLNPFAWGPDLTYLNDPNHLINPGPLDPGGLTYLNDPQHLINHRPIDPGGLSYLSDPNHLLNPKPIDPDGLTRLSVPSHVITGVHSAPESSESSFDRYSQSAEGFSYRHHHGHFDYGGLHFYGPWAVTYFPGGAAFFPGYAPNYEGGITYPSPYTYLYGALSPYIGSDYIYNLPPEYDYVPYPLYQDETYQGHQQDDVDSYYLNRPQQDTNHYRVGEETKKDPLLDAAISDIQNAWTKGDAQLLAKHIRRDARVAVYLRGKYQYSLDSGDYLDMTRDALRATKTVRFALTDVERKQNDVYTVLGRHVYTDKDGKERTVHVSYVLQKEDNEYYITQVGTAPDKIEQTDPPAQNQ